MCKLVKITIFLAIVSIASFLSAANIMWSGGISMNPPTPVVGQVVTFTATFTVNPGPATNIRAIGGVDSTNIYDRRWARSFATNTSQRINFTWTATAGSHRAFFTVDPDNVVGETNETDNTTQINFTVTATGTTEAYYANNIAPVEMYNPNIPGPDIDIDDVAFTPSPIRNGEMVEFRVHVFNRGNRGTLRDFKVMFQISCTNPASLLDLGEGSVAPLGPGQSQNVFVKYRFTAQSPEWLTVPRNCYFSAWADRYDVIRELAENNNSSGAYLVF